MPRHPERQRHTNRRHHHGAPSHHQRRLYPLVTVIATVIATLAAVPMLRTACATSQPSTQPTAQLLHECVSNGQTTVTYGAQVGLTGVDVSIYDTNHDASTPTGGPECMTTHERIFIQALANIQTQGIAHATQLRRTAARTSDASPGIPDRIPPATPHRTLTPRHQLGSSRGTRR